MNPEHTAEAIQPWMILVAAGITLPALGIYAITKIADQIDKISYEESVRKIQADKERFLSENPPPPNARLK